DKLRLYEVILCGLSMGGYIALKAIEKFPRRFDSLVLSDTQCLADTLKEKQKRMKAIESIKENGVEKYADLSIKNLFAPGSFRTNVEEIAAVRNMIINTSVQSISRTLFALSVRQETCSKLYKIEVPVLIMAGKEDKITPPDSARLMKEHIQFSRLRILEHAGHIANMENPWEFNNHLIGFLHSQIKRAVSIAY
ncbi:MAG: alpha/beta fold hydrolase, partial [Bacteroidia bacterium]|nr:alpha/beta fold hydrolase [Bacteroidia bacterium]